MSRTVICRICETEQPVNPRGVIKRHDAKNSDFYCDGSLKPEAWGLPTESPLKILSDTPL